MLILLALIAGVLAGRLLRAHTRLIDVANTLSLLLVYVLLFLLGVSVGSNNTIMAGLGHLGGQALALSIGSIGGSVFLAFFLYRFLFRIDEK